MISRSQTGNVNTVVFVLKARSIKVLNTIPKLKPTKLLDWSCPRLINSATPEKYSMKKKPVVLALY